MTSLKEKARIEALNALDRLAESGRVDDKIELIKGRDGKVHVKTYILDLSGTKAANLDG